MAICGPVFLRCIICTYWLSRRAGQENIWLQVRAYGPSAARSAPPDREPNIFPSGPTLLSQWAFYHTATYCWKFWKFCFNLNTAWLHKIGRLRARNNYMNVSTTKICNLFLLVEQETHNSSKTTTHFLIFVHAKKPTESWHKAVKNMSKPSKTATSDKRSLHASLKLLWRLTILSASFQAICRAICRPLGFSCKTIKPKGQPATEFNDTDVGSCKQCLGLLTFLALLV